MNPVARFFKSIDNILNKCVDYFDYRIRTGKFIDDINYYVNLVTGFCTENGKKVYNATFKSKSYYSLSTAIRSMWQSIMKIPPLAILISFLLDTLKIVVTCYSEIFIVIALTFPTSILLFNWFQTSIIAFSIGIIPILLLNLYCVSALFYCIRKKLDGERISIWHSFHILIPRFGSIISPALLQASIILESTLGFIIVALFLSYVFNLINIPWGNSFVYWFIVLFIGFVLLLGIIIFSIIMHQTYFVILLENLSFQQAFKRSRTNVYAKFPYYFFASIITYLLLGFIISKATLSYIYLGFTIGLYCATIFVSQIAFLLWKKFPPPTSLETPLPERPSTFFIIIIFFGFMNYILFAAFMITEYQPFISYVQQQENNYLTSQEMKQYTNRIYNYTIQYPNAWTVYEWTDKSTTFYNNYTGTITGGTWMTINVATYDQQAFDQLFNAPPGLVIEVGTTKNVTTKVTNMNMQGYDTVNYTFIKSGVPYSQYETHYLIHKENLMYDIAFISLTNDVANYDSDLFTKIISSFSFTQ